MLAQQPPAPQTATPTISTPQPAHTVTKTVHYWHLATYYGMLLWENTIIIILSLQSLHGLYTASKFIIADLAILEAHFQGQAESPEEVTLILTEAIGLMLGTIINIMFAIRLSKAQERLSRVLELVIGTALVIWYSQILHFLTSLDYTLINNWLSSFKLGNFF